MKLGNSDGEDNNAVHKQANDEPMEVDENSEQPENEGKFFIFCSYTLEKLVKSFEVMNR